MRSTIFLLLLVLFFAPIFSYGQEKYPNCIDPEIISLPLKNDSVQEQIYYEQTDKYTYWYKINAATTTTLSYKFSSISKDDDYEILIYNFSGDNFCNDVVYKKVRPDINTANGGFEVKKGETYYLGELYINGFGCGHSLSIIENNKQKIYRAIQNNCIEEAMETIVVEKIEAIKEIEQPVKPNQVITGFVLNSNTQKSIEAIIEIKDLKGNNSEQLVSNVENGFVLKDYLQKEIVVSITKFGYESFLDTITLKGENLVLELNPIKVGDKLIMRKIYFHPNTYVLREESKSALKKLTKFMLENRKYSFEIQGHTNGNRSVKRIKRYANLGEEWNFKGTSKKLSKLRAEKIKAYLVKNGVSEIQLTTAGYGGDRMIVAKPQNMKQAMKNIRVEVIVIQ
ncbi:MAG: OmpA family protein [Flavobacteriales bacterium]|nr:OmpA family protein [Flavobacteriales bacterium]